MSASLQEPPLDGIKVLEWTAGWAGPLAGYILAHFGATVVKIESVDRLDWWRSATGEPGEAADDPLYEKSHLFNTVNRNKRGITLDLKDETCRRVFDDLIQWCDVFIENFSPRASRSLGVTFDDLRKINPRLLMVSAPAFGLEGPWAQFPGFGSSLEEMSGLCSTNRYPGDDAPKMFAHNPTDPLMGGFAALGLVAALSRRIADGDGGLIEVSHIEAAVTLMGPEIVAATCEAVPSVRGVEASERSVVCGLFPCSGDDEWIAIVATTSEECEALHRILRLGDVGRQLDQVVSSGAWAEQLGSALIAQQTVAWDKEELQRALQGAGVAAGAVLDPKEVIGNPQFWARGHFDVLDRRHVGAHPYPTFPVRFDSVAHAEGVPAPTLGEHNREVLTDIVGLNEEEISRLERSGKIGTFPRSN